MYGIYSLVIDGNALQIPNEEIDGRPGFQGKEGLPNRKGNPAGIGMRSSGETSASSLSGKGPQSALIPLLSGKGVDTCGKIPLPR